MRKTWFRRVLSCVVSGSLLLAGASFIPSDVSYAAGNYARVSVHDPSVVRTEDGGYFIIGSHLGAAKSDDMMNWRSAANSDRGSTNTTFFGDIYKELAIPEKWSNTSAGYNLAGNMWAPDIIYNKDMQKYCMYLSVNGVDWHSSIVLCTADNIEGPYKYEGTIVWSGFETRPANPANSYKNTDVEKVLGKDPDLGRYLNGQGRWNAAYGTNAIDPAVFYDEEGKLWMVYGSWFGGIYMLELDEQTGLRDYNVKYPLTANTSDPYLGTHVAGGQWASGEGPYIEYMKDPVTGKGWYYLFISYGYFNSNGGYNMRLFRSESPDGPYTDQNGNSAVFPRGGDNIGGNTGERLMSNYQWSCNKKPFKAQGHNSALMDSDGKLYVIYHTKFDDNFGAHEVRVHQLIMNEDGWITAAPYEYSGETLSENGHSVEAVTGEYEFIFHTLNQRFENEKSADVEKPKKINLAPDGTITGDIKGSWSMRSGTPYMSVTIGDVVYKGAFLPQEDESGDNTLHMTFSATGNNTCIWGSKKAAYVKAADVTETVRIEEGKYTLKNVNSGLYIAEDSGNVIQSQSQPWEIKAVADGVYAIIEEKGNALTVDGSSPDDGANISVSTFSDAENQKFTAVLNDDGSYSFMSIVSGKVRCLDVYNISKDDGANICQWEFWGGDGQKFILEAAEIPEIKGLAGDVNCDEKVDLSDAVLIMQYLSNPAMYGVNGSETTHMTEQGKANGDVIGGGDGITNMDALEIQKFMLDLVDSLEIGG